ncbi:MAG: hypothetical protein ABI778_08250 [Ignavibacteriota bacterium]
MNKLPKVFATFFAVAVALMIGALVVGCKNTSEPTSSQQYDSEAAADLHATALGTESGGAGVSFADVQSLTKNGTISGTMVDPKSNTPSSRDTSFDPVTKLHTLVITRGNSFGKYSFSALITYNYTFFDAAGKAMDKFTQGTTEKIVIAVAKSRSKDLGDRVDVDDTASGYWTITNIIAGTPIVNGTFSRSGTDVFHTAANGDRTFTHSFTISFSNDTLVKDNDNNHVYLSGPATSHFEATTPKGYNVVRDTKITFNGDGTAALEITRTSGDGTVDTFTIDVKVGYFKRFGK